MRRTFLHLALIGVISLTVGAPLRAGYLDDVGFTLLGQELGTAAPDGTSVWVAQIESRTDTANPDAFPNFLPDAADAEFSGKSLLPLSPNGQVSSHATLVGRRYYGNSTSMARGISNVGAYWTDDWLSSGFLRSGTLAGPLPTSFRISNHSWVGSGGNTLDVLKRVDYVVETYDHLQVAAVNNDANPNDGNNPVQPMVTGAFNAITTGLTNGNHAVGTVNSGGSYSGTRTRPHLVAPATATSNTAPVVAAAAALLVQTAHTQQDLSKGSYEVATDLGTYTVYHGETSEVIRAALMAGAQRHDVAGYDPSTANHLDRRFGAGELDIYNSYHILAAGEQDSIERGGAASGIDRRGFDYAAEFATSDVATYSFVPDANSTMLFATLSWNIDVVGGDAIFSGTTRLSNFDLELIHFADDRIEVVAASDGTGDTTENLWLADLTPGEHYALRVTRNDSLGAWDYGLAWQITHDPDAPLYGDLNGDQLVDLDDLTPFMIALTNPATYAALYPGIDAATIGDVNRDGRLDNADIDSFNVLLGGGPPLMLDTSPGNLVPEPASLALVLVTGAFLALAARRWR